MLSLLETIKQNSTFRAKAFRLKVGSLIVSGGEKTYIYGIPSMCF